MIHNLASFSELEVVAITSFDAETDTITLTGDHLEDIAEGDLISVWVDTDSLFYVLPVASVGEELVEGNTVITVLENTIPENLDESTDHVVLADLGATPIHTQRDDRSGLVQVQLSGTGNTATIYGKVSDDAPWLEVVSFTESGAKVVALFPKMKAEFYVEANAAALGAWLDE